jgi:ACDE family multidrug resistance protein
MSEVTNKKALFIILAAGTLAVMAGSIISPVISLMQGNLQGADENNIRFVITTHALFIAIFSPIFGIIIDRIGAKKPFAFGLILYGIAGALGLFIADITTMIISRAFLGIAVAAIANPLVVLILNAYKGDECSKIMGWQASIASLGGVIWPLLGGALGILAWNLPFGIYLAGIPIGLFAWLIIPEVFDKRKPETEATDTISVLQTVKQKPFILAVYGLGLWMMVLLYANVTFVPQLLARAFSINNSLAISSFIGAMGIAAAISAFMYKRIKSKFSYSVIAFVVLSLWAFGLILLSQAISILTVLVMMVLFGIGQGMVMPTLNLWVGELTKTCARGRMISYLTTFLFIGQFLPPIIFNPIFSALSFNGVFLIAGITCSILTVLFLINWRKSRGKS